MHTLKRVFPHIWHLRFKSGYDVAMNFLRAQEYYEGTKYHRKFFTIVDYMEWYAGKHGEGSFPYATDWLGFNVPNWALEEVYGDPLKIPDPNKYDWFMHSVYLNISFQEKGHPFYLIGTSAENEGDDAGLLDHELCHAFYTVDPDYKKKVKATLKKLPKPAYDRIFKAVKDMGYHPSVVADEIHAYSATGLCEELVRKISKRSTKPFQKLFEEKLEQCQKEAEK